MSIRDGLMGYYSNFGIRGVLAISAYRLFGRPKEITAHPPAIRNPVHLRVRTSDTFVYGEILLRGQYSFDLPFSPRTIVDAGANIGMTSIYLTHRYPEARIVAIEPEASNFAVLVRNVRPYPAIIPVHAALWYRDGEISVGKPTPASAAGDKWGFVTREGSGIKVRAMTMRTLKKELQMCSVDLLKIDIEGSEKEVFDVCDWMDDVNCLMIELHDRFKPGCREAVDSVAQGFSKLQRGDTTLYIRQKIGAETMSA
jgi:FkbM family methyltransferase